MIEGEADVDIKFHQPSKVKQVLERVGIDIEPKDIVEDEKSLFLLLQKYPDLAGDPNFGFGNDGGCPSYTGHKGWWKELVKPKIP